MYRNNFSSDSRMRNRHQNFGSHEASCMNTARQNSEGSCMNNTRQNSEASCMNNTCQNSEASYMNNTRQNSGASCMNNTRQNSGASCMNNSHQNSESSCMNHMHDMALAMAYVPWQHFNTLYELPMALQIGTIFPELNKPFRGSKGGMKCSCRQ